MESRKKKKERVAWFLRFGQVKRGELEKKAKSDFPGLFKEVIKHLFGLPLEDGEEVEDNKVGRMYNQHIKPSPEKYGLSLVIYGHDACREFLEEVLKPLRKGGFKSARIKLESTLNVMSVSVTEDGERKSYIRATPSALDPILGPEPTYEDVKAVVYNNLLDLLREINLRDIKECEICGALFYPLNIRRKARFCSQRCRNVAMQRAFQARKRAKKRVTKEVK